MYKDICKKLVDHYGSISEAARQTGISYTAFYALLEGNTADPLFSTVIKLTQAAEDAEIEVKCKVEMG